MKSTPTLCHDGVTRMQVVAYLEVTPDIMPAKIYVNETAQALRGFMEPFSQGYNQPSSSNCTDLINRVMIAGMPVSLHCLLSPPLISQVLGSSSPSYCSVSD